MKKIVFIVPGKYFYGIDKKISEEMIEYLKKNFKVIIFNDFEDFLNIKYSIRKIIKLFYYFIKFKILSPDYVFSINAGYIILQNIRVGNRYYNIFADIFNIPCILRWDHFNEQIILLGRQLTNNNKIFKIINYLDFFIKKINSKNFYHYSWQINSYFSKDNFMEKLLDKKIKFKSLNTSFIWKNKSSSNFYEEFNKKLGLMGIVEDTDNKKEVKLKKIDKLNSNFFSYENYTFIDDCRITYNKKKKLILNEFEVDFYGLMTENLSFRIVGLNKFYEMCKYYKYIINPINDSHLTITSKFYTIFNHDGFCLQEKPPIIPRMLNDISDLIFYKDLVQLKEKINYFENNHSEYVSVKLKIKELSNLFMQDVEKEFYNEFK